MKNFSIESPCNENWNQMTATEKGAFCQKCSTDVHDFTNKSNDEIRSVLRDNIGNKICGRYTDTQHAGLNADFNAWQSKSQRTVQRAMVFSLIVVFGLTLFSCNSPKEEQAIIDAQVSLAELTAANEAKKAQEAAAVLVRQKLAVVEIELVDIKAERIALDQVQEIQQVREKDLIAVNIIEQRVERDLIVYTMGVSISSEHFNDYLVRGEVRSVEPITVELDANGIEFPTEFDSKVFPNPATEATSLEIKSPTKQEQVVIALYDMSGSYIQSIHEGELERGTHTYPINLIDLQPGIYLVVINSNGYKQTVRISKT